MSQLSLRRKRSIYWATTLPFVVYVGTELHCEPWFACALSTTKILYYASVPLCTTCVCLLSTYMEKCPQNCFVRVCACSMWTTKIWKMLGATPTFHRHRSPLWTMVHNAGRWCTKQISDAQLKSCTLKWCTNPSLPWTWWKLRMGTHVQGYLPISMISPPHI